MMFRLTPIKSSEARSFELAGQTVDIVRSPRARRMRLAVDPRSGRVKLTLPKRTSEREGMRWAHNHADWLARESAKLPMAEAITPGMTLLVAGEALVLDWQPKASRVPKRIADALIVGGDETDISARVIRWLKREALRVLEVETREIAAQSGVSIGKVGIGDPVGRWGSCSAKGDIRYSWRLILAPSHVRRATVAHEVAHRTHMNHSAAFHAHAAELFGADPKPARQWLKAHGTKLHWFGRAA
jgi:predicted metal-dependent hydrolase